MAYDYPVVIPEFRRSEFRRIFTQFIRQFVAVENKIPAYDKTVHNPDVSLGSNRTENSIMIPPYQNQTRFT